MKVVNGEKEWTTNVYLPCINLFLFLQENEKNRKRSKSISFNRKKMLFVNLIYDKD